MSLLEINYSDYQNASGRCKISDKPDTCPICGHNIDPVICCAYMRGSAVDRNLEIVFKCPNKDCKHLFVAYYSLPYTQRTGQYFVLSLSTLPLKIDHKEFGGIIDEISAQFSRIYNQAMLAESNGLDQVCGCGYRRALEFLVKDYLIHLSAEKEEEIKNLWLGQAIQRIDDENIRTCAERAAWLGNDETHYVRVWEGKDIEHLKDLIGLVVNWIESCEKTKKYTKEMMK
jgi:hypothetical protein